MVYSPRSNHSHRMNKVNKSKSTSSHKYFYLTIPLVFLLGFGLGYLVWGRVGDSSKATETAQKRYTVSTDDDPYLGPVDAPVTIIMFSDYQCTFCQKWYLEVMHPLMQNYEGKIRFVYRDFPLSTIHASASIVAEAADCAGDQMKYWNFFDAVFSGSDELNDETIQKYANSINLDINLFNQCLSTHKYQGEVEADFSYAAALGVQSTPTFFVNGIPVIGAQPYEVFKSLVDQELSN